LTGERSRLIVPETNSLNDDGSQDSLQAQESHYYNPRQQVAKVKLPLKFINLSVMKNLETIEKK
jgi:hypothetical protein